MSVLMLAVQTVKKCEVFYDLLRDSMQEMF